MVSLPAVPPRHLFGVVWGFFLPLAIVTVFNPEQPKINKFTWVLHGLKKQWFSTSNTRSVSDDKKAAAAAVEAQSKNFIVLFLLSLFKQCPFSFSASESLRMDVFYFEAIVYLLSQKLVWIIPKPSSSTQIVPPPHLKKREWKSRLFCVSVRSYQSTPTNCFSRSNYGTNKQWTIGGAVCIPDHRRPSWFEFKLFFFSQKKEVKTATDGKANFPAGGNECNVTLRR